MAVDAVPSDSLHILRSRIISGFFALIVGMFMCFSACLGGCSI